MKKIRLFYLLFFLFFSIPSFSQFQAHSFVFDQISRTYYIHVPTSYTGANPVPIVVWLHGMGNISVEQVQHLYAANQFIPISEQEGFILLVPVAINYSLLNMRAWNSRAGLLGIYPNTDVDDIGFINAMLDTTIATYNINLDRIYLCGFSMGGFMTERMALEDHTRFAAFASVSGTIGNGISNPTPGRAIPIAHFHGTADNNVSYHNNPYGIDPDSLVHFWIANNGCDTIPTTHTSYTDVGQNGTLTVDHYIYSGGNAAVEFFKANNSTHEWLPKTSQKIWMFFNKHSGALGIKNQKHTPNITVYPNPVNKKLFISFPQSGLKTDYWVQLYTIQGKLVYQKRSHQKKLILPIQQKLNSGGLYILQIKNQYFVYTQKIQVIE